MHRYYIHSEMPLEGLYTADPTSSESKQCNNVLVPIAVINAV